jgi:hypothetical protein
VTISILDYGAIADGKTDCSPAFDRALAQVKTGHDTRIYWPEGEYFCARTLVLDYRAILAGAYGWGDVPATRLIFPADVVGIRVEHAPAGKGADWSGLWQLGLLCRTPAGPAHGIILNARASIELCNIRGFGGDGIHIEASAKGTPPTNANGWQVGRCRVVQCQGDGLHTIGPDSNAGTCYGLDVNACGGWGVNDESFLGNTYYSPQVAACKTGSYRTINANARNVFINPYGETGQPPADLRAPTLVIGGLLAYSTTSTFAALQCKYSGPLLVTSSGGYAWTSINGAGDLEGYGHGPPAGGYHRRGERIYAINPAAGAHMGWVCVYGGTPGTWRTFGPIAS